MMLRDGLTAGARHSQALQIGPLIVQSLQSIGLCLTERQCLVTEDPFWDSGRDQSFDDNLPCRGHIWVWGWLYWPILIKVDEESRQQRRVQDE